jgi:hypothetical protein
MLVITELLLKITTEENCTDVPKKYRNKRGDRIQALRLLNYIKIIELHNVSSCPSSWVCGVLTYYQRWGEFNIHSG